MSRPLPTLLFAELRETANLPRDEAAGGIKLLIWSINIIYNKL